MFHKSVSIFLIFTTAILFNACFNLPLNNNPKCSDLAVINKLTKILNSGDKKVTVDIDTAENNLDSDEQKGKRSCYVSVDYFNASTGMTEVTQVVYTVSMDDKEKNIIVDVIEQ